MFYTKYRRWATAAVLMLLLDGLLLGPVLVMGSGLVSGRAFTYVSPAAEPQDLPEPAAAPVFREEQTYTAVLAHETVYCYSDVLAKGVERVMTAGRDGELRCTALVTYVDGVETQRETLSRRVTVNPVTEVIAVGTGLLAAGMPTGNVVIEDGVITLPTGEKLTYTDTMQVRATGYTHTDAGCDMITSTGTTVRIGTVAVDPRYIPYGTRMFIVSNDGSYIYGISVAEDCGGAIKGDRVDLYFPTTRECFQFGRRNCTVYFLGKA